MATELIPFKDDSKLPAHLRGVVGSMQNDELVGGVSAGYPVLSFKGKTWSLREGGTANIIMKEDDEDEVATSLELVIVKANPHLSKVYYETGYTEGSDAKPTCYSNNGTTPASDATEPQSATCALCPHNAWGSRISENGSKGKACSDSRRVAVAAAGDLGRPMLLRIPAATLKDRAGYAQMLTQRNAPYQAVVTKVGFDPTVAHPKLTFKAVRWLSAEEFAEVSDVMKSDLVRQIAGLDEAAAPAATAALPPKPKHVDAEDAPAPKPKAAATVGTSKGTSFGRKAPVETEEDAEEPAPKPKGRTLASKAAPAKADPPKSKAAEKVVEIGEDLDAALATLDDL
jgi:hypothetical protein